MLVEMKTTNVTRIQGENLRRREFKALLNVHNPQDAGHLRLVSNSSGANNA